VFVALEGLIFGELIMFKSDEILVITEEVIHPETREVILSPGDKVALSALGLLAGAYDIDNVKVLAGRKSRRLFFYLQGSFNPGPAIVGWFRPASIHG
jgi:hypothetical protein